MPPPNLNDLELVTTTWTAIVTAAPTPSTRTIALDVGGSMWPAIGARVRVELVNDDDDALPVEHTDLPDPTITSFRGLER